MPAKLKVVGLKELRADLRKIESDGTWKPELRSAALAAANVVADEAKRRGGQSFTNLAGGRAALGSKGIGSIRALASQTRGQVAGGGAGVPWYGGSDFGSHGAYRQFPGAKSEGRFIYPALEDKQQEVLDTYRDALDGVIRKHF